MKSNYLRITIISFMLFFFLLNSSCQNSTKKEDNARNMSASQKNNTFPEAKSEAEWKKTLTPAQFEVMVKKGTEAPFKNPYYNNHEKGIYVSAATGEPLFSSEDKFDSGTGWPAFSKPLNEEAVIWVKDKSLGMVRDEVIEKSTGLHLGHVFHDGPPPTNLRYCINSAALKFVKSE